MNEWDLQRVLTKQWTERGLLIEREPHLLVAWEVMTPSWQINDAKHNWSEPSFDFLVIDADQRFTVIELKTEVPGIKPAWQTLCQVTHRAATVTQTFSPDNLERAHRACWTGQHGRVPTAQARAFASRFHDVFARPFNPSNPLREVRRCVAALQFGESWPDVLAEFNRLPPDELLRRAREELTSKSAERERTRFTQLTPHQLRAFIHPVTVFPLT